MTETIKEVDKKSKKSKNKPRSRLYPRYHLEHAVNFAKAVYDLGGRSISKEAVAQKIGKATNNSAFIGRVSSARQFGLINMQNGKISVTEIGQRVLYPKGSQDRQVALIQAFSMPSLYKDLINNYNGKVLPDSSSLANVLMLDYEIQKNARSWAASNFLHSADWIDLIQKGILVVNNVSEVGENGFPVPTNDNPLSPTETYNPLQKPQEMAGFSAVPIADGKVLVINIRADLKDSILAMTNPELNNDYAEFIKAAQTFDEKYSPKEQKTEPEESSEEE